MNAYKLADLDGKELLSLIKDNYLKIGMKINPSAHELSIFIDGMRKYQNRTPIDVFNDAFDELSAGIIELKRRPEFSSYYCHLAIKEYRNKHTTKLTTTMAPKWQPSTDEGYFNSLVEVMNGTFSDTYKEKHPEWESLSRPKYGEIPMLWDWCAVYRHLCLLREIEMIEKETLNNQKQVVIDWLVSKWKKDITFQSIKFAVSPLSTGKLKDIFSKPFYDKADLRQRSGESNA